MKRIYQLLLTVLALFCIASPTIADVIATGDIWTGSIQRPPDLTEATFNLYMHTGSEYWGDWITSIPSSDYLFRETITPSSVGSTFVLESGSNYDSAVSLLTNGINDYIVYGTQSLYLDYDHGTGVSSWLPSQDLGYVYTENSKFSLTGSPVSAGDPVQDFSNYNIDKIALAITGIEWDTYNVNWYDGTQQTFTNIELSGILTIEGTPVSEPVPEPATMLLLGSGLAGLFGFRRRFKKR